MAKRAKAAYDSKNFIISSAEAGALRTAYLLGPMRNYVRRFMNDFPEVNTVLIQVSQYYDDEASDAVHFQMYPTVLSAFDFPEPEKPWRTKKGHLVTPSTPNWYHAYRSEHPSIMEKNLPFVEPPVKGEREYDIRYCRSLYDVVSRWEERTFGWGRRAVWESNGAMIPLFAAFCTEGGSSGDYQPLCVYRRAAEGVLGMDGVAFEFVGKMLRPEVDGMRPDGYPEDIDEDFFAWLRKQIALCEETSHDPLAEMREHVKRPDLVSRDEERNSPQGLLFWNMKGPVVREKEAERISTMDDALRELHAEWDRRKKFDAEFDKKFKR